MKMAGCEVVKLAQDLSSMLLLKYILKKAEAGYGLDKLSKGWWSS